MILYVLFIYIHQFNVLRLHLFFDLQLYIILNLRYYIYIYDIEFIYWKYFIFNDSKYTICLDDIYIYTIHICIYCICDTVCIYRIFLILYVRYHIHTVLSIYVYISDIFEIQVTQPDHQLPSWTGFASLAPSHCLRWWPCCPAGVCALSVAAFCGVLRQEGAAVIKNRAGFLASRFY